MANTTDVLMLLLMLLFMAAMLKNRTVTPVAAYMSNIVESNLIGYIDRVLIEDVPKKVETVRRCNIIYGLLHNEVWVHTSDESICIGTYCCDKMDLIDSMFIGKTVENAKQYLIETKRAYILL